jgi:hypothetical protein
MWSKIGRSGPEGLIEWHRAQSFACPLALPNAALALPDRMCACTTNAGIHAVHPTKTYECVTPVSQLTFQRQSDSHVVSNELTVVARVRCLATPAGVYLTITL